jgi:hypothetical protein
MKVKLRKQIGILGLCAALLFILPGNTATVTAVTSSKESVQAEITKLEKEIKILNNLQYYLHRCQCGKN